MGISVFRWQFCTCQKRGSCVGLTKVGKGSKIMLTTDKQGVPLTGAIESAQRAEVKLALSTIDSICVPKRPLHPKIRPDSLCADKAYDAEWLREELRRRNVNPRIPRKRKRGQTKAPSMSKELERDYKERWIVERTFSWLGNSRRLLIRWEKYTEVYQGFFKLACIMLCLSRVLK